MNIIINYYSMNKTKSRITNNVKELRLLHEKPLFNVASLTFTQDSYERVYNSFPTLEKFPLFPLKSPKDENSFSSLGNSFNLELSSSEANTRVIGDLQLDRLPDPTQRTSSLEFLGLVMDKILYLG